MAAAPGGTRLQQMLQSAVQSVQWTYSLFWQFCPQQGMLIWADGYYNGAIKTRKTVQPMEVTAEEASLQRSQQLRELYDSLSAAETDQPPARRPCASLSPEDLTESEWYYLMCVSFSFPIGLGLPGKAYTKRQYVWLTGANEVDSKVFSRAILAKSARVQTVVCIPLMDGVVEVGTTERVQEDPSLIQHIKTFFADVHQHYNPPKPALSEHSTSNPVAAASSSKHHTRFHSPPVPMYSSPAAVDTNPVAGVDDNEVDDDDEEEEEENGSDSGGETAATVSAGTGRRSNRKRPSSSTSVGADHQFNIANNSIELQGNVAEVGAAAAEPSELMQLEMSEDIRIGSPDDASNNLESDYRMIGVGISKAGGSSIMGNIQQQRRAGSFRDAESSRRWPAAVVQDQLPSNTILPQQQQQQLSAGGGGGASIVEELSQEDTHYSQTVSTILQYQTTRWSTESSLSPSYLTYSPQSAFSKYNNPRSSDLHIIPPIIPPAAIQGTSQLILKYILLTVPYLHIKYRDENPPKSISSVDQLQQQQQQTSSNNLRLRTNKGAPQDELMSANHVLAERRRREKLNERFIILRSLVPFVTKMDKASILGDTIEYVKQLRRKIQDLEARTRQMETERLRLLDHTTTTTSKSAAAAMTTGTTPPQALETTTSSPQVVQHQRMTTATTNSNSLILLSTKEQQRSGGSGVISGTAALVAADRVRVASSQDRRKMRVVEEIATTTAKANKAAVVEMPPSPPPPSDMLQVSIIESDGLIEMHCPYKEGLLLDVMLMLREMRVEVTCVQSSLNNGFFIAELRAKVKENVSGKKASIIEVKKAINQIVPHTTD